MSNEGKFDQTKGNIKETVADFTGNKDIEKDGKKDKNAGKAKEYIEKTGEKANKIIDDITEKFEK